MKQFVTNHGTITFGTFTHIMAILNVTPDSFSGDGLGINLDLIVERALDAERQGATILDIGGESTRPNHKPVAVEEELARVIPAITAIREVSQLPISVDTMKKDVAKQALAAGADIINDVRGFLFDPGLAEIAAVSGAPVVVMHDCAPTPGKDLIDSVRDELLVRAERIEQLGVARGNIALDPGFGFGKSFHQNLELLKRLNELHVPDYVLLVGLSRKRMIGWALGLSERERSEGTLATTVMAIERGADIVRVHDVQANVRAAKMTDAIVRHFPDAPQLA